MATTPNFNWSTPDNTGLVKNGALDIRTLGNSIDASMADLKGGTTGQVLSKASNTDMDFVWAADAGAPTSLGFAAGKNTILNGDFRLNQRSFTSLTCSGTDQYGFDRWLGVGNTGTVTYSTQAFTAGTAPVTGYEGTNFARMVTSGQSGVSAYAILSQKIESVRSFANQTITVSFWAKTASGTPKVAIEMSQNFGSGGSAGVNTYAGQATISTSWARYSVTVAIPSISGKTIGAGDCLALNIWFASGTALDSRTGSIGIQTGTFDIWGVQAEAGSTMTAFQTATGTLQGELAACQRYYQRRIANSSDFGNGFTYSTTGAIFPIQFLTTMRVAPTALEQTGTAGDYRVGAVASFTCTAVPTFYAANTYSISLLATSTGMTAGQGARLFSDLANTYLGWSAEL